MIAANIIYLGFANLFKILWHHEFWLSIQNSGTHKSNLKTFKP